MVKIWEIDFTKYRPDDNKIALDSVGSNDLTSYWSIERLYGLPGGLSNRPGVRFRNDNNVRNYGIPSPGRWNDSYSPTGRRSFVFWFYTNGTGTDYNGSIWGSTNDGTGAQFGLSTVNNYLWYRYNSGNAQFSSSQIFSSTSWHLVIVTVDRNNNEQRCYHNNSLKISLNSVSNMFPTSANDHFLGNLVWDNQAGFDVGYIASYDHILDSSERTAIYNAFLNNSPAGESPIQTISGTVYDLNNLPVSGADIYLVRDNSSSQLIDLYTTTDANGHYRLDIDLAGNYILVSSNMPGQGSIAQPMIVTNSGITYL